MLYISLWYRISRNGWRPDPDCCKHRHFTAGTHDHKEIEKLVRMLQVPVDDAGVSSFLTAHQHIIGYFSALQWCEYRDKIVEI